MTETPGAPSFPETLQPLKSDYQPAGADFSWFLLPLSLFLVLAFVLLISRMGRHHPATKPHAPDPQLLEAIDRDRSLALNFQSDADGVDIPAPPPQNQLQKNPARDAV